MSRSSYEVVNSFLSSLRAAFAEAAETASGDDKSFLTHMDRLMAIDLDHARFLSARGNGAAAIRHAGDAALSTLDRIAETISPDNAEGRGIYNRLAYMILVNSADMGVDLAGRLEDQVKAAFSTCEAAPRAVTLVAPPNAVNSYPLLFSRTPPVMPRA